MGDHIGPMLGDNPTDEDLGVTGKKRRLYTQADLDAAVNEALERAALVADAHNQDPYPQTSYDRGWAGSAQAIANVIRAMKKETGK